MANPRVIVTLRDHQGKRWLWALMGNDEISLETDMTKRLPAMEMGHMSIVDFKVVRDADRG